MTARVLTWVEAWGIAQFAAFMTMPDETGHFLVRLVLGFAFGLLAVLYWAGIYWGMRRIVAAWDRYRARRRAIEEATP